MIKKLVFIIAFFCFALAAAAQNIPKLKMADVVKNFEQKNDSIYIINFWATFCKPCVAEIPNFIKISNKYKKDKVKLMLVSLDLPSFYPKRIAAFATKNNFATNIAWLEETDADYFCPMIDKSWGGSIPATIIVNTKTGYKKFFEKELSAVEFEKELKKAIGEHTSAVTKPIRKNNNSKDHSFDPVKEPE
jgi:thiol-disulfide isomerase/thioredoxin